MIHTTLPVHYEAGHTDHFIIPNERATRITLSLNDTNKSPSIQIIFDKMFDLTLVKNLTWHAPWPNLLITQIWWE